MHRKIAMMALAPLALVLLGTSASAGVATPRLQVGLTSITGGQPPKVVPGKNNTMYVKVSNPRGSISIKIVKLKFSPGEVIYSSSVVPSKAVGFYDPHLTATWTFKNFRPGTSRQVRLKLNLPPPPSWKYPTYTVAIEAQGLGTQARASRLVRLKFSPPASASNG